MATRIGMHFSLWAAAWTRESAELAVPECARYGLEVIEIPLLAPERSARGGWPPWRAPGSWRPV